MAITNPQEYEDFFYEADTGGLTLERFMEALDYDDNVCWRLDPGHLVNLLEESLEYVRRYRELEK